MSDGILPDDTGSAASVIVHQALRSRRSIRRYRPEMPPEDVLRRLFLTAAMAPSAHNRQPWRYLVIRNARVKTKLASAMGQRLMDDRRGDGDSEDAIRRDVARSHERISGAPVLVVVCLTLEDMDAYPDPRRGNAEYLMAIQSTAMAAQSLLVAADSEGLGSCWMCAPLFCPDVVGAALGVPSHWFPQGLLTLGFPAESGRLKPRKPLEDVVFLGDGEAPAPWSLSGEASGSGEGERAACA